MYKLLKYLESSRNLWIFSLNPRTFKKIVHEIRRNPKKFIEAQEKLKNFREIQVSEIFEKLKKSAVGFENLKKVIQKATENFHKIGKKTSKSFSKIFVNY